MPNRPVQIAGLIVSLCIAMGALGGCAGSSNHPKDASSALPSLSESSDWKQWEYPNNVGRTVTDSSDEGLVLYQAATRDSLAEVAEHYAQVSGIKGLTNLSPPGAWLAEHVEGRERVHAKQSPADFGRGPGDRAPNECSFVARMSDYTVTAYIRQEPPTENTRITLVFEKRAK